MPEDIPPSKELPQDATYVLQKYLCVAFKLGYNSIFDRPIYATTLYLACCHIELKYGIFTCHTFQDIIHKGYILALVYGNIKTDAELYCRLHSSCVTSETMRSCDCDCSEKLEKALYQIANNGQDILFYFMQEGRGAGYLAKSRDRMLVQATKDSISTFEAYHVLGFKKDYRAYSNIIAIFKILHLSPKITLLTNNPNKVEAIKLLGVEIIRTQSLKLEPNPFNLAYLRSKKKSGHTFKKTPDKNLHNIQPPEAIIPFKPCALPKAQRFIYIASYWLPTRPIHAQIILSKCKFENYFTSNRPIDKLLAGRHPLVHNYTYLDDQCILIKVNKRNLALYKHKYPQESLINLLSRPYWFCVHVYSDIVSAKDFVVLTYRRIYDHSIPIVRLQSESLFNRFPLKDTANRDKFNASVQKIVHYGCGIIALLYNDGRGAGFDAYGEDIMMKERGITQNTTQSYHELGIDYDRRDYRAAVALLKHHLLNSKIQMIVNTPRSLVLKPEYTAALNAHQVEVQRWIFLKQISEQSA